MSWGEPKALSPFPESSPFFGLDIPEDVTVESQVMAQPDPALSERTIASLTDGTPLVTRAPLGQGSVVLFHVTANADWSSLPLSGLFVQMLERLAVSTRPAMPEADDVAGITWVPEQVLDGFGTLRDAGIRPGVPGEIMVDRALVGRPAARPLRGGEQRLARNVVIDGETELSPATWPASIPVEGMAVIQATTSWRRSSRGAAAPAGGRAGRALAGRAAERPDRSRTGAGWSRAAACLAGAVRDASRRVRTPAMA
jgi:hypothetical protein